MGKFGTLIVLLTWTLFLGTSCTSIARLYNVREIELSDLPQALKNSKAGEVIYIKGGDYSDQNIVLSKRADKNVTIRPKIAGTVKVAGASTFTITNSNNLVIEGFLFERTTGATIVMDNSQNIRIENNYFFQCGSSHTNSIIRFKNAASDNRVINNTFDGSRALCIVVATSRDNPRDANNTGNEITYNYFVNTPSVKSAYPKSNGNGMEAIQIGLDFDETIGYKLKTKVFRNLFENIVGDGVEIISNKSSSNEIVQNTFLNNRSGITIRSGDGVKIEGNYLNLTSRGIRLFGADHVVRNNYIRGSNIGISLPSADFRKGGRMEYTGYYQQENIDISENVIIDPKNYAIQMGSGTRKLMPENIKLTSNRIYTLGSATDYDLGGKVDRSRIQYNSNETILSREDARSPDSRSSTVGDKKDNSVLAIKEVTGIDPFTSNDPKVGAEWRRPEIKNSL
ncbi:chondroitinase-B domain-containing protein [Algoriphagus sp. NG3]|uniref:chondroitinase-B domain-containing protein n=1 Tax=Algoriphagus sp. NG3 TaxID=3097546 RepID=UPI002A812383|nr:chondroitinase-B domain-containing protein [Algoriphagus sp. NG3]WPR77822.1 chondroitinase-B domain-containing protein [Algoriphagus sp. NG3]